MSDETVTDEQLIHTLEQAGSWHCAEAARRLRSRDARQLSQPSEVEALRGEVDRLRAAFSGTLDEDLQFILGQPCFAFIRHARLWRSAGHKLRHRAEDEQAFFIGRMLHHYFTTPGSWRESWDDEIKAVAASARAALGEDGK